MPSRVSTAPRTVPCNCSAIATSPTSRSRSIGVRSAGSASQASSSDSGARPRAAARKSAVRVFWAAEIQKSFFAVSSLTDATK